MTGAEFAATYGKRGLPAWEKAALDLARQGQLTPWPWTEMTFEGVDAEGVPHTVTLQVRSDVLSVGPIGEHLRLPLTPRTAQNILNLDGSLLPTPWLDYLIWRTSPVKLQRLPIGAVPGEVGNQNQGAVMRQWVNHSAAIDAQLANVPPDVRRSGQKKAVVVSNIYRPGYVLIHGWYKPEPDVYDDGSNWQVPTRQPQQVESNAHVALYIDYSHGIWVVGPMAIVDGQPIPTETLYQHPVLWKLVSRDGPVRFARYPADIAPPPLPQPSRPVGVSAYPAAVDEVDRGGNGGSGGGPLFISSRPPVADLGLMVIPQLLGRRR